MILPRSKVDDALMALVKNAYKWQYASKHLQHWSQVGLQPAVFVRRVDEDISQKAYGANKYVLLYEIWVYVQVDWQNPDADIYGQTINPILDAIDNAMDAGRLPDGRNILGTPGIDNARISGKADIADGSTDGQALMVVPVQVFVGGS